MLRRLLHSISPASKRKQAEHEQETDEAIEAIRNKPLGSEVNIKIEQPKSGKAWIGVAVAIGAGVAEFVRRLWVE